LKNIIGKKINKKLNTNPILKEEIKKKKKTFLTLYMNNKSDESYP
jgi:hypothetical protein